MKALAGRQSPFFPLLLFVALTGSSSLHAAPPKYPPVLQKQDSIVAIAKSQQKLAVCWIKAAVAKLAPDRPLDSNCLALLKPSIMSIYPYSPVGGEEVKVSGTNLKRANISIAGATIAPVFRSDNELRFIAPEHAMGDYDLKIESVVGSATARIVYAQQLLANPDAGQSSFSSSNGTSCIVTPDGLVKCWGANQHGQLGNGAFVDSPTPVTVTGITDAIAVATGYQRVCALLATGTVQCWGMSLPGYGLPASAVPLPVAGITNAIALSMSQYHACVVLTTHQVQCWGSNSDGQLGDGTFGSSATPVTAIGFSNAVSLFTSNKNTCAVTSTQRVWCWGDNADLQLRKDGVDRPKPVLINESQGVRSIVSVSGIGYSGYGGICTLLTTGTVRCWHADDRTFYDDPQISNAIAVPSGTSCALLSDARVQCFSGSVQDGIGEDGVVIGVEDAKAVFAYGAGRCAVLGSGHIQCWGSKLNSVAWNSSGPVTTGIAQATATDINGVTGCAVLTTGTVKCWGANYEGQIGNGTEVDSLVPVTVSGISDAVAVGVGNGHTCTLLNAGKIKCWGLGAFGQLGTNGFSDSLVPVPVTGVSNAVALSIAGYQSAALLADGTPMHWGFTASYSIEQWPDETGENPNGGTLTVDFHDPLPVAMPFPGARAMHDSCLLQSTDDITCWNTVSVGYSHNEPPDYWPDPEVRHPVLAYTSLHLDGVIDFSYRCFVAAGGSVQCRSRNSNAMVAVPGISNAVAIEMSGVHACVLLATGAVQCWGSNQYGQLGNGTYANSPTPVYVAGLNGSGIKAVAIAVAGDNSCAILETGPLVCWGRADMGQLAQSPKAFIFRETLDIDLDDIEDSADNCPLAWNPDQLDNNGNGKGDSCESISL